MTAPSPDSAPPPRRKPSVNSSAQASDATGAPREFSVVALIAAYNEADVVDTVIGDLVRQGVAVHFIDNWSTDATLEIARGWLGRGVRAVEQFPAPGAATAESRRTFPWEAILHRKEELASEIEADWFIHHDADEFRESPWRHLSLREALRLVDASGFNAVDFSVLNFRPTRLDSGATDIRDRMLYYEPGDVWDRLQIKCWKRMPGVRVDLASQGGHEALFADRRIFPIRFLLRHYPIRSQEHGERKIAADRQARFLEAEKARGWHFQYRSLGGTFVRDAAELVAFDPDRARLELFLRNRTTEELGAALEASARAAAERLAQAMARLTEAEERAAGLERHRATVFPALEADLRRTVAEKVERDRQLSELHALRAREQAELQERLALEHAALGREVQRRAELERENAGVHKALLAAEERRAEVAGRVDVLAAELSAARGEVAVSQDRLAAEQRRREFVEHESAELASRLTARLEAAERRLVELHESRSWRWTAPVRSALDRLSSLRRTGRRTER